MRNGALLGAITLSFLAGCVAPAADPEEFQSHDDQEVLLSFEELMTGWTQEGEWMVSPALDAPEGVSRVGVLVTMAVPAIMPVFEARLLEAGEPISEWTRLTETWAEDEQHVAIVDLDGIGDGAQLRVHLEHLEELEMLRWSAAIPENPELAPEDLEPEIDLEGLDGDIAGSTEALRSELRNLGIVTRAQWGARAGRCTSQNSSKNRFAIHHTVTGRSNPAAQLRSMQRYHMDSRGWCDIGYHFLIGTDGKVYEGRPLHLLGAHVGGHNTGNIGISFIGCFHTSGCSGFGSTTPSSAMINAAGRLAGTLRRLYGIRISSSTLKGHRDHSGQSTSCPGNNLHRQLGTIRTIAQNQQLGRSSGGSGGGSTGGGSAGAGSCKHTYGGTYSNKACSASYQCCDGKWRTRGACGSCACTERTGQRGCTVSSGGGGGSTGGGSCKHTYGGTYSNKGCSAGYQCCDGKWRTKGACGSCSCTEATGQRGCSASSGPPAGSACTHSYGGRYANTACSAGYQCCNGRWRTRGACGSCYCVESTGQRGCGT